MDNETVTISSTDWQYLSYQIATVHEEAREEDEGIPLGVMLSLACLEEAADRVNRKLRRER